MNHIILTLILVCSVFGPTTLAFAPSSVSTKGVSGPLYAAKLPALSRKLPQIPTVSNPFKRLPWNVEKELIREKRKLKLERSKIHRELGIPAGATYDEIKAAVSKLTKEYDESTIQGKKSIMKIELMETKLLEASLSERLAGQLEMTKEALEKSESESGRQPMNDEMYETEAQQAAKKKSKEWNAPAWTKGLIVKPDEEQIKKQIKLWGVLSFLGLAFPPFIPYSNRFTWLIFIAQLCFRGMPKDTLQGGGMAMGFSSRGSKSHIKVAWLIGIGISFVGAVLTYGLMPAWARGKRWSPIAIYSMRNFIYGVACCYFQPYKKGPGSESTDRKSVV